MAACGCKMLRIPYPRIEYCPEHAAAPDMLQQLYNNLRHLRCDCGPICNETCDLACTKAVIAKAEGR